MENLVSPRIPPNSLPRRLPGFVLHWVDGELVVRARDNNARQVLNLTAAFVWQLCDGRHSTGEMLEQLHRQFSGVDDRQLRADLVQVLYELQDQALVDLSTAKEPKSAPLLRVGFCNYPSAFQPLNNYFLWLLSEHAIVLVVNPLHETPDVLFYSTAVSGGYHHSASSLANTVKVFFSDTGAEPDDDDFDLAFTDPTHATGPSDRRLPMPPWAASVSWLDSQEDPGEAAYPRLVRPRRQFKDASACFCAAFEPRTAAQDEFLRLLLNKAEVSGYAQSYRYVPDVGSRGTGLSRDALKGCKFALVFDDGSNPIRDAKALFDALLTRTIPVYCGSPAALLGFNENAFIDCENFKTLDEVAELIIDIERNPALYERFIAAPILDRAALDAEAPHALQRLLFQNGEASPAPAQPHAAAAPKLTIGMATYDDYDGVYFSVQAIRMFHPEVTGETEIIVVDNNPDGVCGDSLKRLEQWIPGFRYVPCEAPQGTAIAKGQVFVEANGQYVLCIDCHVLLVPGALRQLIDYFDGNPTCMDLLQGPMVYDDMQNITTHFDPVWRGGMYGTWAYDDRGADPGSAPLEIPMQGMGLFACRREAWLGFNPRFRGFGGEEGYIHEKFRQAGRRTLCLPFLRWLHRFGRPFGTRYENHWHDRIRNYLIGFSELGLDTDAVEDHFTAFLGAGVFDDAMKSVAAELDSPFFMFDGVFCIGREALPAKEKRIKEAFAPLGCDKVVQLRPYADTPASNEINTILSHRRIVAEARRRRLGSVLIVEDRARFTNGAQYHLRRALQHIPGDWEVLCLSGDGGGPAVAPGSHVRNTSGPCSTVVVAYRHTVYDAVLQQLPDTIAAAKAWLAHVGEYDPSRFSAGACYTVVPPLVRSTGRRRKPAGIRGKRSYLICAADYNPSSAGIRSLHKLVHLLNENGFYAYTTGRTNSEWTERHVDVEEAKKLAAEDSIVVYPETIAGNPLGARIVVRYILAKPGLLGGPFTFDESETKFCYSEPLTKYVGDPPRILEIPCIELELFNNRDKLPRSGTVFYVGKGVNVPRIPETDRAFEITRMPNVPASRRELAQLFKTSELFYSYDNFTALIEESRLCGCPAVVIPDPNYTKQELVSITGEYGLSYGLGDIERARQTVGDFLPFYLSRINKTFRLDDFIEVTQELEPRSESRAP